MTVSLSRVLTRGCSTASADVPIRRERRHRIRESVLLASVLGVLFWVTVYVLASVSPLTFGNAAQRAATADIVQFLKSRGADLPPTIVFWSCPLSDQQGLPDLMGQTVRVPLFYLVFICTDSPMHENHDPTLTLAHEFGHVVTESAPQELRDKAARLGYFAEWNINMQEWVAEHFRYSYEIGHGYKWAGLFIDP